MDTLVKILVVEDEMLIGANISMQLTGMGYEVTGILPRGEEALLHVQENKPDIVLLDIQLKGKLDGIETALQLQQQFDIPVIFSRPIRMRPHSTAQNNRGLMHLLQNLINSSTCSAQ